MDLKCFNMADFDRLFYTIHFSVFSDGHLNHTALEKAKGKHFSSFMNVASTFFQMSGFKLLSLLIYVLKIWLA